MSFMLIVVDDANGWQVDREALTAFIRAQWAGVGICAGNDGGIRDLIWEFETRHGPGEAYLHENGTCLVMDVWPEDAIRLAIAFRDLTPGHLEMVLCDDCYSFDVRLHAGTTEAEFTALVDAAV